MSTCLENHDIFILGLLFTSVVALPQETYVTDVNYNTLLSLRIDEVYSIVNTATKYPLLNTAPNGPELTYLSHWWQFVPVSENVYYLQTQDVAFNSTAPRWGRFIRLQISDLHLETYHMLPVTCYNFDKNRLPKNNTPTTSNYIYVDYFDKYGRDQSECVNRTRIEGAGWSTNLTEERVYTKPDGMLDKSNFLYKISPVGERVKERLLKEGVGRIEFSAGQVRMDKDTLLLLPDLEIKEAAIKYDESPADNEDDSGELLFFKCHWGHDVTLERRIWSLYLPSGEEFSLMINSRLGQKRQFLSIEGTVHAGRIGKHSKLVDLDWKIVSSVTSNLTWLTISGFPFGNFGDHNTSTNYFSFRGDGPIVRFHYSDTNPNFVVTFHNVEPPSGEDGFICSRSYDAIFYSNYVFMGHKFEKQCVFTVLTITLCLVFVLTYLIRCCIRNKKLSAHRERNVASSTAILVDFEEGEFSKPEVQHSKPEVDPNQCY